MGTVAKETGGDFELTPAGTHLAICYMVVDIGLQKSMYGVKPKIIIGWELPLELMKDGRPFGISNVYTLSLSEKALLRRDLEGWRGRAFTEQERAGFDIKNVLGKPCTLTVVHNQSGDKTYANIASIGGVMKGMEVPQRSNELAYYNMDEPSAQVYAMLPKWIQKKIDESVQAEDEAYAGAEANHAPEFDDEIPF